MHADDRRARGHVQIERHARNVLIDYFRGGFNPVAVRKLIK
jgi:hypothetical protein